MRTLFLRFYRFTGLRGLYSIFAAGFTVLAVIFAGFGALTNAGGVLLLIFLSTIGAAVATVMAAAKYRRSAATHGYEEILLPLLRSRREYCLVLRPFGHDGRIILPATMRRNEMRTAGRGARVAVKVESNLANRGGFTPNVSMEQVVATAARRALNLETYAIVDQEVLFAPPGLTFMRVPNDEWRMVAQRLIRRAHSIVLIVPPSRTTGPGFAWEVEQIVRYGLHTRVVIVLPPDDQDILAHKKALRQAGVLLAMLESSDLQTGFRHDLVRDYETELPANTLVLKSSTGTSDVTTWGVARAEQPRQTGSKKKRRRKKEKKKVVSDETYLGGLIEALRTSDNELWGREFASRYPWEYLDSDFLGRG